MCNVRLKFNFIIISVVLSLYLFICSGCLSLLGSKKQIKTGNAQEQINDLSSELGVVKDNQNSLLAQMDAKLNATIAGINNAVSNELKAGRDAINTMNDTGLMKVIMLALCLLLAFCLIGYILIIKRMFTLQKERQHYKTLFKGRDYKDEPNNKS